MENGRVVLTGTEIRHGGAFPQSQGAESDQQEAEKTLGHAQGLGKFGREEAAAPGTGIGHRVHLRLASAGWTLATALLQPIGEQLAAAALTRLTRYAAACVQMRRWSFTAAATPFALIFGHFGRHLATLGAEKNLVKVDLCCDYSVNSLAVTLVAASLPANLQQFQKKNSIFVVSVNESLCFVKETWFNLTRKRHSGHTVCDS